MCVCICVTEWILVQHWVVCPVPHSLTDYVGHYYYLPPQVKLRHTQF